MQVDGKLLWAIISAAAVWLCVISIWAGKIHSDVLRLKQDRKDDSQAFKSIFETFERTCREIRSDMKKGLYRDDGQTIFMPRSGCVEAREKFAGEVERRMEACGNLHRQEVGELSRDIKRLCAKFESWQSQVGTLLGSVSKFMDRTDNMFPHILSGGKSPIFNQQGGIDYDRLAEAVERRKKAD